MLREVSVATCPVPTERQKSELQRTIIFWVSVGVAGKVGVHVSASPSPYEPFYLRFLIVVDPVHRVWVFLERQILSTDESG